MGLGLVAQDVGPSGELGDRNREPVPGSLSQDMAHGVRTHFIGQEVDPCTLYSFRTIVINASQSEDFSLF